MKRLYRSILRMRPAFLGVAIKRMLGVRRRVVQTSHGRFFLDPASSFGFTLEFEGTYEPSMTHAVNTLLQPGDVFLDIGANEGYFSILAASRVGSTGRVFAIEPQTRLQAVLTRNIAENNTFQVCVLQRAVSDRCGVASFSLAPDVHTGSSGIFNTARYRNPTESVLQTPLTQLLHILQIDRIRLVKIDVEGFEYEVVLGSPEAFRRGVFDHIALEMHPSILARRKKPPSDVTDFLATCGYRRNASFKNLVLSRSEADV